VTDADLVARAREGDDSAFGELVERHRAAVFRATLAALGSHAEADDAAQDAFVLAYKRLDGFRGDASFKTWLLAIAWRQAISRRRGVRRWWRRLGASPAPDGETPGAGEIAGTAPSPEEQAAAGQLRAAIVAAVRRLPPKLRDALLLAQAGEYSYEEIAAMLRIPVGTLKWRVSEARRKVRQRLDERGFGRG
jgi:RNA polymerase sigma-70 factor (ECF subfamily)